MNNYEIRLLTKKFYLDYPISIYPEMEDKEFRPFLVLLVKIESNTFAIPFRTNVKHSYCYKFTNTSRTTSSATALDFSKAVVVNNSLYLGPLATIDRKEFIELSSKSVFIINKFCNFIKKYKRIMNEPDKYKYEFNLLSNYSTLKYFHKELGI